MQNRKITPPAAEPPEAVNSCHMLHCDNPACDYMGNGTLHRGVSYTSPEYVRAEHEKLKALKSGT